MYILHEHFGRCELLSGTFCTMPSVSVSFYPAHAFVADEPKCTFGMSSSIAMSVLHVVNGSSFFIAPPPFFLGVILLFFVGVGGVGRERRGKGFGKGSFCIPSAFALKGKVLDLP